MQSNGPLFFEHMLREHIAAARKRCEEFDVALGEASSSDWIIEYKSEDGGKWRVSAPWRYRLETTVRAASLEAALDIAFSTIRAQKAASNLPSQIAFTPEA
jgi:hypothetical protein